MSSPASHAPSSSPWAPLRNPVFRAIWIATVVSNVGSWMHDAAAGWTMAVLAPSPLLVSLMQTATTLPFFVLGLPAGAIADIVDRRRVLLAAQVWMLVVAAVLGLLTIAGHLTPWLLLAFSFALGLGNALTAPAWQAIVPELVERQLLPAAVALSGVAVNMARAVGPALGGALVAALGPGWVFLLNAASFLAVVAVVYRWRRVIEKTDTPPEPMGSAMRAGARFVRHAAPFRAVLARSAAFIVPASAIWALLPLVARQQLALDARGYGLLLGCLGAGAITGPTILPRLRRRFAVDRLLASATVAYATGTVLVAIARMPAVAAVGLLGAGVAWMTTMSTLNVAAQSAVPAWVRGRALAVNLLVIQGGMAFGSVGWGAIAARTSIPAALLFSAAAFGASLVVAARFPLAGLERLDLTPTVQFAAPVIAGDTELDAGPVLVTVEYRIDPAQADAFAATMQEMGKVRRRDGAIEWGLFRDAAEPARYVETFLVDSWGEHLRQHARGTVADRQIRDRVYAFQLDGRPTVSHLIAKRPPHGGAAGA